MKKHIAGASLFVTALLLSFCSDQKRDDLSRNPTDSVSAKIAPDTVPRNSVQSNLSLDQIASQPFRVILTGMPQYRLVSIYKRNEVQVSNRARSSSKSYYESEADYWISEIETHFMPGLDLVRGFELINVAHYDMIQEQLHLLFDHPVIIKSIYFPSFVQDSLYQKPVNRDYFMISVYDEDTNKNELISTTDLRRIYKFSSSGREKLMILPPNYSVVRSEYDPKNDAIFFFARHDLSGDGRVTDTEPLHVFWTSLKSPGVAKRLY